ncbi:MAG: peptidoglycan DD-metalloendopeptidase family protein [Synechococcales cyanobacterium CRU_2_2]|nr:peptidoglycan DD-metalloendopeptidase family protein [Synechococcales cyanobacterium CRU_2_2]
MSPEGAVSGLVQPQLLSEVAVEPVAVETAVAVSAQSDLEPSLEPKLEIMASSAGLLYAQAVGGATEAIAPVPPAIEPVAVEPVAPEPPAPVEQYAPEPVAPESVAPEPIAPEPVSEPLPAPDLQAPVVNLTPADLAPPPAEIGNGNSGMGTEGSGAVIDTSDLYSTGATNREDGQQLERPPVVVTERAPAGGCQQTLQDNGLSCGAAAVSAPRPGAAQPTTAVSSTAAENGQPASGLGNGSSATADAFPRVILAPSVSSTSSGVGRTVFQAPDAPSTTQISGTASSSSGYSVTFPSRMPNPLQFAVQNLGRSLTQSADAASYYARTQRPGALPGNGDRSLLFPLTLPTPISSVFGWRIHPIHGSWRFHSGIDLAADMGVPVVAPLSGTISTADFIGGYGLTITVDHSAGKTQTLFGHLSEIFVRPGQFVRQGEVIGRVGSTGGSTGPHLHFEVRQQDGQGSWVAVDPSRYLEGSVAQLMNVLRNEPLQLSPIPIAQNPFKIKPSLSTGLLPLLQKPQDAQADLALQAGFAQQLSGSAQLGFAQPRAFTPSTSLERAVVQVVRSLETRPSGRVVRGGLSQPRAAAPTSGQPVSATSPQAQSVNSSSPSPQAPQKLSQLP